MTLFKSICFALGVALTTTASAQAATRLEESRAVAADLKAAMNEMGEASKAGDMKRACTASRRSLDLLDRYIVIFKDIRDSNPNAPADVIADSHLIQAKLSNQYTELKGLSEEICAKAG